MNYRVSGLEYVCTYIGHACTSQLHVYAYTLETLTQKLKAEKLKKQKI